uniref:DNA-(apurinic or apyrimidinic site) lyase n=1 Tax=Marseillevirus LCMAC201 TaxID=2506605 RepID=A0A481YXZ3_9VIRU|nr:MAG: formamidopyrimidine-DNA glycosylase [Marseillevirus LCMAC201]
MKIYNTSRVATWFNNSDSPNPTVETPQPYNKIGDGPEGPEVYVMTQRMYSRFPSGTILVQIEILNERYSDIPADFLKKLPLKIIDITSKGKKTIVKFNKKRVLLISYGMSGHWETSPSKHAQLEFTFATPVGLQSKYYWVSSRSLPTCVVRFLDYATLNSELDKLGLDIIHDDPDPEVVIDVYGKTRKNICAFMMDQTKFAGIGNYIKAVVLYRCEISPHRKTNELDDCEKWLIWETAQEVASEAISAKGMGIRDYKDESGKRVGVAFDITPYNKKKDSKGNTVVTEYIAGRTTWWVPAVQH